MGDLNNVFKAYDIRGVYPKEVDEDLAWKVGHACGQFLRSLLSGYERGQAASNRLVVGRDMRPSSESLSTALVQGITASGVGCILIGLCDTPMVYFAVSHLGTCGGIQVTASHNPIQYNGFKISGAKSRPVGQDTGLKEIQRICAAVRRMPVEASIAPATQLDLWEPYRKHVLKFFRAPRRLRVVVDTSNGMGGKAVPQIFGNVDVQIIPLNFEIGQGFVHEPNPLIEANLRQVKSAVRRHRADLGVCLDGDADRCAFIDENGKTVPSDLITALLARHFLRDNPGAMVVYDLRSSRVVADEIRAAGGLPRRERVGHAFMKKTLADGHGVFGGELSGHFYFRDNYNCDSGVIALASVISVVAQQDRMFSELIAPLKRYAQSGEINFSVPDKSAKMKEVADAFPGAEIDTLDGITIQYEDWWCNVRPSNTEPLLRLNVEAANPRKLRDKLKKLQGILGTPVAH